MNMTHLIDIANDSGGTLYLMLVLLLLAGTVVLVHVPPPISTPGR